MFPIFPLFKKELFPVSFFRSVKKKLAFPFFLFILFPFRLFHFVVLFLHSSELGRYSCLFFPCSTLQSYFLVHLNKEKLALVSFLFVWLCTAISSFIWIRKGLLFPFSLFNFALLFPRTFEQGKVLCSFFPYSTLQCSFF